MAKSERDDTARTMRIALPEPAPRPPPPAVKVRGASPTSFVARRLATEDDRRASDYKQLLESIYDGVIITDRKGRIVDFNSRAIDFLLKHGDELAGMRVIDFISGAGDDLLAAIHRNLKEHRYTLIEGRCIRSDGTTFPAEIAVNRIALDEGGQLCFLIRDITVRKRAQEDLEEAISRLEAHDRARSQFVSNVSHELRTPLTSMIYAVSNMLRGVVGPLSDNARRYLEMLEGDCRRLLTTVNDILDLRKIESNTLVLERSRVPFGMLVGRSVGSMRFQAEQKSLVLNVTIPDRRWFVDCDAAKIERVVLNVVGNALKFTPERGRIDVTVEDDPDRARHVRVSVQDSGVGIPPAALSKVTLRYFTVGEQPSGSGLGLAISKEIVDLHGGVLTIQSPPPGHARGTVVRFSLPLSEPPLVLIVSRNAETAAVLREPLAREGYRIAIRRDVETAVTDLMNEDSSMVVLDFTESDALGTGIVTRVKGTKALVNRPLVALTGPGSSEAARKIVRTFAIAELHDRTNESALCKLVADAFLR